MATLYDQMQEIFIKKYPQPKGVEWVDRSPNIVLRELENMSEHVIASSYISKWIGWASAVICFEEIGKVTQDNSFFGGGEYDVWLTTDNLKKDSKVYVIKDGV